jgi:hypothetical protein
MTRINGVTAVADIAAIFMCAPHARIREPILHQFHKFTIDFKQTEKRRKPALNLHSAHNQILTLGSAHDNQGKGCRDGGKRLGQEEI